MLESLAGSKVAFDYLPEALADAYTDENKYNEFRFEAMVNFSVRAPTRCRENRTRNSLIKLPRKMQMSNVYMTERTVLRGYWFLCAAYAVARVMWACNISLRYPTVDEYIAARCQSQRNRTLQFGIEKIMVSNN